MKIIDLHNLAFILMPAGIVIFILYKWNIPGNNALYALSRMLIQLLLIGYILEYIFSKNTPQFTLSIITVMCFFSSWIALGSVKEKRRQWLKYAIASIALGGGCTLGLIIVLVLTPSPWYSAQIVIPLTGMIFASCMNSISLAADRYLAEITAEKPYKEARNHAYKTAMIPTINGLLAVGVVSLPGMMTGQILSGISPLIAVRYQIMVMLMIFAASGLAAAMFLTTIKPK